MRIAKVLALLFFLSVALGKTFYEFSGGAVFTYTWDIEESSWSRTMFPFFSVATGKDYGRDAVSMGIEIHPFTMKDSFRDGEFRYPDGRLESTDEDYKSTYLLFGSYRRKLLGNFYARAYLGLSWVNVYGVIKRYKGDILLDVHEYRTGEWGIAAGGSLGVFWGRRKKVSFFGEIFALNTEILSFGEKGSPQWFFGFKLVAKF